MAFSTLTRDPLKDEVRIILVGKKGVGKSATANTILGEDKFESRRFSTSALQSCEHASTKRFGKYLQIVDAPGFLGKQSTRISQWVLHLPSGIHAILFVMRIGRYTEEDVKTVEDFIKTFGSMAREYVIAVFTGADDLSENCDLQTYIKNADSPLKNFLKEINYRYIAVNNRLSFEDNNTFVETLLTKIEDMQRVNGGSYYTCHMFEEAEEHVKKVEAKKLKKIEENNRERDEKMTLETTQKYKAELEKRRGKKETQDALLQDKMTFHRGDVDERNRYEAREEVPFSLSLSKGLLSAAIAAGIGYCCTRDAIGGVAGALIGATCYGYSWT